MDTKKDGTFFENVLSEAKNISKRVFTETGKTYQSFKTNMDIMNLKKRHRERCGDLGYKIFLLVKEGKLTVPGVEYIISELKALDFQIKLKEEDLIEIAAADPATVVKTDPNEIVPQSEKAAEPPQKDVKPTEKTVEEVKTVRLDKEDLQAKKEKAPVVPPIETVTPVVEKAAEHEVPPPGDETPQDEAAAELVAVKGIGGKTADLLIEAGIDSVERLSTADPEFLGKILNRSAKAAQKLIDAATEHLA